MDNKIENMFDGAFLSAAAYVDFNKGENDVQLVEKILSKVRDWKGKGDKIALFLDRYEVLHHQPNTGTGFSATVFSKKGENDNVRFVNRGTE